MFQKIIRVDLSGTMGDQGISELGGAGGMKRRLVGEDDHMDLKQLQNDIEDILVLDADEDDIFDFNSENEMQPNGSRTFKQPSTSRNPEARNLELEIKITSGIGRGRRVQHTLKGVTQNDGPTGENDDKEDDNCQMKWLRTVGIGETGNILCKVTQGPTGDTESINADTLRELINNYRKKRIELVDRDGVVATPLHVVKQLANKHQEGVHYEAFVYPNGFQRVELFSGTVRGVGEGVTKRIAAQMAAIDMLQKVQLSGAAVKVPATAFLPGWLTSNRVFADLFAVCKAKGLAAPKIKSGPNVNDDGLMTTQKPPFRAECWVGTDLVTIGESEADIFARREAAKEMFNLVTNVEYNDTPYGIGQSCKRAEELTSAGIKPIMSDYKKAWLLQYRVKNNLLAIPEEEEGLDNIQQIEELEKDLGDVGQNNLRLTTYKRLKSDKLIITAGSSNQRQICYEASEKE